MSIYKLEEVLVYIRKFIEVGLDQIIFLFLCLLFFIIRVNIIVTISKSVITTIITTIAVVCVAAFRNFIAYHLFFVV